jgi:protein O-GlcNAc transferase
MAKMTPRQAFDLAFHHHQAGQLAEAEQVYRQILAQVPRHFDSLHGLAILARQAGHIEVAIQLFHRALAVNPASAEAHTHLAFTLRVNGQIDQSISAHRKAIELNNNSADYHSNLLFDLNFQHSVDAQDVFNEHRAWADRYAAALTAKTISHPNDRSPDRKLRIGYVSPDFIRHSVAYFLIPLLEHHDRDAVEIFCYSSVKHPDEYTHRIRRSTSAWRDIANISDEAAVNLIRSDAIDILVDLSGHTPGRRPLIYARKPAPIQVTYLGYPNTTGMTAIDYRLTDSLADLPGLTEYLNSEKLWRLPTCAWCYQPPDDSPEIRPRPDGPITFGCFNAFAKLNSPLAVLWAELLKKVSGSRLLLKSSGIKAVSSQHWLISEFARLGISNDRIELQGRASASRDHFDLYNRVDIALDSYPYRGTATTCEALWMGVPVVTLAGSTHLSRVGVSILTNAGLSELIASSPDQYVSLAQQLAQTPSRLADLRRTLRAQIRVSPLTNAVRFAAEIDSAYRQMWRIWCGLS